MLAARSGRDLISKTKVACRKGWAQESWKEEVEAGIIKIHYMHVGNTQFLKKKKRLGDGGSFP